MQRFLLSFSFWREIVKIADWDEWVSTMDVIIGMIIVVSIFIFRFIKSGQQIYRVIVIESNEKYSYEYGGLSYYTFYQCTCYDLKKLKSLAVIFFNIFHIFSKKSIKWNLIIIFDQVLRFINFNQLIRCMYKRFININY